MAWISRAEITRILTELERANKRYGVLEDQYSDTYKELQTLKREKAEASFDAYVAKYGECYVYTVDEDDNFSLRNALVYTFRLTWKDELQEITGRRFTSKDAAFAAGEDALKRLAMDKRYGAESDPMRYYNTSRGILRASTPADAWRIGYAV